MKPLEMAAGMKRDTIAFYRDAVKTCSHPVGRTMFEVILEDEERHLRHIEQSLSDTPPTMDAPSSREALKSAVASLQDVMSVRIACTLDEMEAFRLAMEKEKEAFDTYTRWANETENEQEQELFRQLAHEEDEHFRIFSNTYSFLDDTGNWFMWEEYSIVEG